MIPESQNRKTLPSQPTGPHCILFFLLHVLAAIGLDDNTSVITDEIHNIGADLLLAPGLQPADLLCSQMAPQDPFCICGVFSQFSGRRSEVRSCHAGNTITLP